MKSTADDVSLILFDLDGTLYRSTEILLRSYRKGIERFREQTENTAPQPSREEILSQIGRTEHEIRQELFPELTGSSYRTLREFIVEQLLAQIRRGEGELVDGVHEVLGELRGGLDLGLMTNADRAYLETVVESHDLGEYFGRMRCIEDVSGDDKSLIVKGMLDHFQVRPQATLVVGDRASDREAAQSAGTQFLGCNYGYGDAEEFSDDLRITQLSQVLQFPPVRRAIMSRRVKPDD